VAVELADFTLDTGEHVVQFYEDEAQLAHSVGGYLTGAIEEGAVAIVIATEAHRDAFEEVLEAVGRDPTTCKLDGQLIVLDAAETMAQFVHDGQVDADRFREIVGTVVARAAETGRPVRAYGEMVALLWDAGDVLAAIRLEEAWNALAREIPFGLVCGYPSESVRGEEHADALSQVCHLHSSVLDAPAASRAPAPEPEICVHFPAERDAPRAARRFVVDALERCGAGGPLLDDARLVVTELATNAVIHAKSPFSVVVRPHGRGVHLSVRDSSRVSPTVRGEDPRAISGRGLRLVATLAADWGVELTANGKTVWVELQA
jgi:anti-sigma regulatory factor (Ser/Thr protein kinase)